MAAEYEELVSKVVIQIAQAKAALAELEKSAGQATQKIEGIGSKGDNAFTSLGSSLKRLAGTFGIVLTAGAVVSFIKRVGESTRQVGLLAARSGQAEKSVRALQNQFKALGYSEAEANSTLENFTQSFSNFAFKGEIGGLAQSFLSLGVNIVDVNGKMKDMNDLLIQAGDAALSINGGDRVKAQQLMLSMGFSTAQADLATRADRRERMEQMKREAVASKEAAEKAEKLSGALNNLGTKLADLVLQADKSFGIFDKAGTAAETAGHVLEGFALIVTRIGDVCSTAGGIMKEAFKPVMGLLQELGDSVDKAAKEGKLPGWAKWLIDGAEGMNTDWQSNDLPATGNGSTAPVGQAASPSRPGVAKNGGFANGMLDLISKGEGDYNSVNLGERYGNRASTRDLTKMTIGQVLRAQEAKEFNAAGRYQFIPRTLRATMKSAGLSENDLFDEKNQDILARQNILNQRAIKDFLTGKSNNLIAAGISMAAQWRSLADPRTGKTYADKGARVNKASIPFSQVREQLLAMRAAYTGEKSTAMYADNQQPGETNTTINIYAPTNDAGDIAKETLKYLPRTSTYVSPMA